MKLKFVCEQRWRVYTICDANGETFLDWLGLPQPVESKLLAALDRLAQFGPKAFSIETQHHVNDDPKIYQLRRGAIRVLWFYDSDLRIICCRAFCKSSQKTPPAEITKAVEAFNAYCAASAAGELEIVED